jgi:hypothetical protein
VVRERRLLLCQIDDCRNVDLYILRRSVLPTNTSSKPVVLAFAFALERQRKGLLGHMRRYRNPGVATDLLCLLDRYPVAVARDILQQFALVKRDAIRNPDSRQPRSSIVARSPVGLALRPPAPRSSRSCSPAAASKIISPALPPAPAANGTRSPSCGASTGSVHYGRPSPDRTSLVHNRKGSKLLKDNGGS